MANYFMYDPKKPGAVYPMKADKTTPLFDLLGGENPNAKKNTCPRCARRMGKRKMVCKCGYTKPEVPSNKGYRIFNFLFLIFAALAIAVLPYYAVYDMPFSYETNSFSLITEQGSMLNHLLNGMVPAKKLFDILPAFAMGHGSETGALYSLSVYAFLLCDVLAVIHALFGMLSREKAVKRATRALFFLGLGAFLYSASFTICLHTFEEAYELLATLPNGSAFVTAGSYAFDFFTALMGVGCLIASYVLRQVVRHPDKVAKKLAKKEAKKAKKCKCK